MLAGQARRASRSSLTGAASSGRRADVAPPVVHRWPSPLLEGRLVRRYERFLVDVKLGVLMLMAKKPLTREIERYLDEHLA